jgi:A nuclease of the HNH/ENDO VII superfamily with conserved LHH
VSDGAALIEQPPGEPGAVMDCAGGLRRVGGGFEGAGQVVSSAVASVGSWEGQASMAFRGHATSYRAAAASCEGVLADAQVVLSRYADVLGEVRQRIRELRREEEDCLDRIRRWKERLADAESRAADAAQRMMAAPLDFGLAGEGALAAQLQAQGDLARAQDDADLARRRIAEEREELERLREQAREARQRAEEAEDRAAGRITLLAGQLPDVQFPGGAASPSAFAGTVFGPPLSPFATDPRWSAATARAVAAEDDEEEDNGGNIGDFLAGGINEFTFGAVDLGGDKDSDMYNAGQVASYIPITPAGVVKTAGTGAVKLGAKAVKSGADDALEAGAKRGADDAAGAGRGGGAAPVAPTSPGRKFWTKTTDFEGHRVYQRDDLIDPMRKDADGLTNLERMRNGLAPIGPDGKKINLHHTTQRNDGSLAEVSQTLHQSQSRVIHINPSSIPSGINRSYFDGVRKRYWMQRADDFTPDPFGRTPGLDLFGP